MSDKSAGSFVPDGGLPADSQARPTAAAKPGQSHTPLSEVDVSDCNMSDIARLQANGVLRVDLGGGGHVK